MATSKRSKSSRAKSSRRPSRRRGARQRTRAARRRSAPRRSLIDHLLGIDALRILKEDHRRVRELFDRYEETSGNVAKQRLAERICDELNLHAKLEEQVFYPAAREAIEDAELVNEADVEHATAKDLIARIQASSPDDEHFDARVKVLGEYIKHHVREEEGELFRQVRRSELDTGALGELMESRRITLMQRMDAQQRRSA